MNKRDKVIGCIIGGAIGDGFGSSYEGKNMPVTIDYNKEWFLSDDTQMTLATCEAILKCEKVDPSVIADTFLSWFKMKRFTGLGASTYKALSELRQGGHWALVGRKGEMAAGNGAAMRIAPLAFCLNPKQYQDRVIIRDVCRITHHNEEAYCGALAVTLAIRVIWDGNLNEKEDLIEHIIKYLPDSSVRDRVIELSKINKLISLSEIAKQYGCSGYVVETVPFALYALQRLGQVGFRTLLEEVISVGGDTDTIASITGQIAGIIIGQYGLPNEMVNRIPDLNAILDIAETFSELVTKSAA